MSVSFHGTLSFLIKRCKKLPDKDTAFFNVCKKDLTDPLVEVEIDGDEVFRTPYIKNDLNPEWHAGNKHYHSVNGAIKEILFKIKDKEKIGSVSVGAKRFAGEELRKFAYLKEATGWFDLRTRDGLGEYLPEAQIELVMKYEPNF